MCRDHKDERQIKSLKRYWLFAGVDYESEGGMWDFRDRYSSLELAQAAWDTESCFLGYDWVHILDSRTGVIVAEATRISGKTETKWTQP